jgi:hypothetical protein
MREGATFLHKTDLQRLHDDIIKACEVSSAPYNSEAIWSVLNVYPEFFKGSPISFRTTTKPPNKRAVNVRYVELDVPHDPFPTALNAGLIQKQGHPVEDIIPEMQSRFPFDGFGGYGVDFGANYGFEKIWGFFNGSQMIEEIYRMPSLPDSVKAHADYFARHNLKDPRLMGVDFRNKSINIYFFAHEIQGFSPEAVVGMIRDLGFTVPSEEIVQHCARSLPIYFTFTWDSPRAERLCFCTHAEKENVPVHLDPVIKQYVEGAPVLNQEGLFIYNITLARDGDFFKIENDYTGTLDISMTKYVPAPMARGNRID